MEQEKMSDSESEDSCDDLTQLQLLQQLDRYVSEKTGLKIEETKVPLVLAPKSTKKRKSSQNNEKNPKASNKTPKENTSSGDQPFEQSVAKKQKCEKTRESDDGNSSIKKKKKKRKKRKSTDTEMMEIELDNPTEESEESPSKSSKKKKKKAIKIESNEDNLSNDNSDDVTQSGDDVNDVSDHFHDVSDFDDDADNFSENEDYDNFDDTNNTSKPHLQCEKQLNEIKSSLGLTKNDFDAYNKRINSEKEGVKISPAVTSRYGVKARPPPEVVVFTPHQKKEKIKAPLETKEEIMDLDKIRWDVRKFGTSALNKRDKKKSTMEMLVKLGAEGPKPEKQPYKILMKERAEAEAKFQRKIRERSKFGDMGVVLDPLKALKEKRAKKKRRLDKNEVRGSTFGQIGRDRGGTHVIQASDIKRISGGNRR